MILGPMSVAIPDGPAKDQDPKTAAVEAGRTPDAGIFKGLFTF